MKTAEMRTVPTHVLKGIHDNNLNMARRIRAEWEIEGVNPVEVTRELTERAPGTIHIVFELPPFPQHVEEKIRDNESAIQNARAIKTAVNYRTVSESEKFAATRTAVKEEIAATRQLKIIKSEWLVDTE